MRLTARQRAFLEQLVKLYREEKGPVHYTQVADAMGVSKFSAYDMLRVLVDKGLASPIYVLEKPVRSPGRSQVMFMPTPEGEVMLSGRCRSFPCVEWKEFKDRLLRKLRKGTSPLHLLRDMLAQYQNAEPPLLYCAGVSTAYLAGLTRLAGKVKYVNPYEAVEKLISGEAGLGTLAGLSLGSIIAQAGEGVDNEFAFQLYQTVERYQAALAQLNEESKTALKNFLLEVIGLFSEEDPVWGHRKA
jgi:hypothetical protein